MKPTTKSEDTVSTMPRRHFLKQSASLLLGSTLPVISSPAFAAKSYGRVRGANERIRIGIIGCGQRGKNHHMEAIHRHAEAMNLEIVAVADPWRVAREEANAKAREWQSADVRQYVSYADLIARDDIDAVMISSPDHLHTTHLEAAARAGKHIYIEKPLATEMDKLLRAVDAVTAAGTVVQVGTQLRSLPGIVGAREVIRNATIGKISLIEERRNASRPYWYNYLNRGVLKADIEWKEFLGDRPMRPFDAKLFEGWFGYYEFSQGPIPQWGAHFLDMIHFMMECGIPESCVCSGGVLTWKDEYAFTAPDFVQATWMYPEGFALMSSNNFGNSAANTRKLFGASGTLKVDNWNAPTYSAEGGRRRDGSIRGENEVAPIPRPDHFLDWFQCMRSGGKPHAPIEEGYQHAVACLMAVKSYDTGKKTLYDPVSRSIKTV